MQETCSSVPQKVVMEEENIFVDIDMQKLHFFSQQTGSRLE